VVPGGKHDPVFRGIAPDVATYARAPNTSDPLRAPLPVAAGAAGDTVCSPWWVAGGADPCAAEVADRWPPPGVLPCSVVDRAGPRVARCQSSRPIASVMVLTAWRMAAAVPRTAAVIASASVRVPAAAAAQPATYPMEACSVSRPSRSART